MAVTLAWRWFRGGRKPAAVPGEERRESLSPAGTATFALPAVVPETPEHMIDGGGNARIMDFGIARTIAGCGLTEAGSTVGTPEYMSLEQCEGPYPGCF